MESGENLFYGKRVTFHQILQQNQLGGAVAILNYLSYRRQNVLGQLAILESDDNLVERLITCAKAFGIAEQILRHLLTQQNSK